MVGGTGPLCIPFRACSQCSRWSSRPAYRHSRALQFADRPERGLRARRGDRGVARREGRRSPRDSAQEGLSNCGQVHAGWRDVPCLFIDCRYEEVIMEMQDHAANGWQDTGFKPGAQSGKYVVVRAAGE